ncbi:MAG: hypothetical protein LUF90_00110 [Rikenellaceae bacterium]|nr:hypothetical protein [Rikenellaceae bacterium]
MKKLLLLSAIIGLMVSCSKDNMEGISVTKESAPQIEHSLVTVNAKITNRLNDYAQVTFKVSTLEFISSASSQGLDVNAVVTPSLEPGESSESRLYIVSTFLLEPPTYLKIGIGQLSEVDNHEVGYTVTTTVLDGSGKVIGQSTESFAEGLFPEDNVYITVDLKTAQDMSAYVISFDIR